MKSLAIFAVMAMCAVCMVPMAESDAAFSNIGGDSVIGTNTDAEYVITYTNNDYLDKQDMSMSISYKAKLVDSTGTTISSGVSPSSGTLDNGVSQTLKVDAPKTAGKVKLIVTYDVEITYTEDGETVEVPEEDLAKEDVFDINVVEPIKLSVTLKNASDVDLSGFGVYFYVDGERMDDSYKTISMTSEGTATVSYNWITDATEGEHKYYILPSDSGNLVEIKGLGEEYTVYIGDSEYNLWIALLVIAIVLLALVMLWVYRKPVKNYGKPKSRR